ncbi:hypothetical protein [Methanorbis rubei]|uniref:Nucleotide-binding protein n=1 Tax=Methanorbis rubei TaxID=3028300 RepID=A0AAE4MG26_9EURY|nr:hypothetical protein [Methanocorpusculaceae archaeon Cs1]
MLTQPERRAVLLLAGVVLLLLAFHLGTTLFVPDGGAVAYSADLADGVLVKHTGTVLDLTFTKTGGHLIVNVSGTDVFVPGGASKLTLLVGDQVTLRGITETYSGKKEIIVNDPSDIAKI